MENYEAFRSEVLKSGNNARVEVNQRALIDKVSYPPLVENL